MNSKPILQQRLQLLKDHNKQMFKQFAKQDIRKVVKTVHKIDKDFKKFVEEIYEEDDTENILKKD